MKADKILEKALEYKDKATGTLGFGFCDLTTGETRFINERVLFQPASVIKIFTLAEIMRMAEKGIISLDDRHTLKAEEQVIGSGVLKSMRPGFTLSVYDYAMLMMIVSDNTAADYCFNLATKEGIKKNVIDRLGLADTKAAIPCSVLCNQLGEYKPDQTPAQKGRQYYYSDFRNKPGYICADCITNTTSMRDIVTFFCAVYHGKFENKTVCNNILNVMKQCQTNSRIPRLLPPLTAVAHKTGTFDRVANDCGIVYTEKGDYVLSLFYNGNTASKEEYFGANFRGVYGDNLLAGLSRDIYEIFTENL